MRIFVYEYICGGGLAGQPLPESLQREGWAMLAAVLNDFRHCEGVQTVTLLDPRLSWRVQRHRRTQWDFVEPGAESSLYRDRTRNADFTLVIAPEFNDLLYERCRWTEESGGRLLGPSSETVRLAGDKLRLAELWHRHGIPTPPTQIVIDALEAIAYPVVCKPRHGAGSLANFLVHSADDLRHALRLSAVNGIRDDFIVQPFVKGTATSVSLLLGPGQCLTLPAVRQILSVDGRFRYHGGLLSMQPDLDRRLQELARRAVGPIEGLHGFVGVDLILGDAADGSEDAAIEINPRLTTSYVGLRALAEYNLADTMLSLALGRPLPERRYRAEIITFLSNGWVRRKKSD